MPPAAGQTVQNLLSRHQKELLAEWMQAQLAATTLRADLMKEAELREQSREFLGLFRTALDGGDNDRMESGGWVALREYLTAISRSRAQQGFSPTETATFILSLKQVMFGRIRADLANDAAALGNELWLATTILDRLALFTT